MCFQLCINESDPISLLETNQACFLLPPGVWTIIRVRTFTQIYKINSTFSYWVLFWGRQGDTTQLCTRHCGRPFIRAGCSHSFLIATPFDRWGNWGIDKLDQGHTACIRLPNQHKVTSGIYLPHSQFKWCHVKHNLHKKKGLPLSIPYWTCCSQRIQASSEQWCKMEWIIKYVEVLSKALGS